MQPPPLSEQEVYAPPRRKNNLVWIILAVVLICGCGGVIGLSAILFPAFQTAKVKAQTARCVSNARRIAMGEIMYATDHDDRFPFSKNWNDTIATYTHTESIFRCPTVSRMTPGGYAMNSAHSGKSMVDIATPATEIDFFETADLTRNVGGNPDKEPPTNRHGKGRTVAHNDGSAKWVKSD